MKLIAPDMIKDWALVINKSLAEGIVPEIWKEAVVTPIIKKTGLDINSTASYRPVSQLSFWARVIEGIVTKLVQGHCEKNKIFHDQQVGFRPHRGTEDAIMFFKEWVLARKDVGECPAIVLLDLSAAFDTVHHSTLVDRVERWGGISGVVLGWIASFLTGRKQQVLFKGVKSYRVQVTQGVPQGSALSPVLFNLYLRPLASLLEQWKLEFIMYADDIELAINCSDDGTRKRDVSEALTQIKYWLTESRLLLNESKTEILHLEQKGCSYHLDEIWPTQWGECPAHTAVARILGAQFAISMDLEVQIKETVKSCNFHLWKISRISKLLSVKERTQLVQAIVMSRLIYALSLMVGAPKYHIYRLQLVQNRALRIIWDLRKYDNVSSVRRESNWLSIEDMLKLKLLGWAWKAVHEFGPVFVRYWLPIRSCGRELRHLSCRTFEQKRFLKQKAGGRKLISLAPHYGRRFRLLCVPSLFGGDLRGN